MVHRVLPGSGSCCRFNNNQANKLTRYRVLSPCGSREKVTALNLLTEPERSQNVLTFPRLRLELPPFTSSQVIASKVWLGFISKHVNVSLKVNVHHLLISFHRPPCWDWNSSGWWQVCEAGDDPGASLTQCFPNFFEPQHILWIVAVNLICWLC